MDSRDIVSNLVRSIGRAWATWRESRTAITEIAAFGRAEIDRIASDLHLSSEELRELVRAGSGSAALLEQRLTANGVASKNIDGCVLRDMQRCCSGCDNKPECAKELKNEPLSAKWPSYCPNEETLKALSSIRCH